MRVPPASCALNRQGIQWDTVPAPGGETSCTDISVCGAERTSRRGADFPRYGVSELRLIRMLEERAWRT